MHSSTFAQRTHAHLKLNSLERYVRNKRMIWRHVSVYVSVSVSTERFFFSNDSLVFSCVFLIFYSLCRCASNSYFTRKQRTLAQLISVYMRFSSAFFVLSRLFVCSPNGTYIYILKMPPAPALPHIQRRWAIICCFVCVRKAHFQNAVWSNIQCALQPFIFIFTCKMYKI